MKPDSVKDGMRVNWASWTACIWLAATVEKVTPRARFEAMNKPSAPSNSGSEPRTGRPKKTAEATRIGPTWT